MAKQDFSSFDYAQYEADAFDSKECPLPRRTIMDGQVEVFALPGHEFKQGRYVLSLTSCAEAVGKSHSSIVKFLPSKRFKAKWGKAFESGNFSVQDSQKPISGVPLPVARIYWLNEAFRNDNPKAEVIIDAMTEMSLETLCDSAFGISRTPDAIQSRFRQLLYTVSAVTWRLRFKPEYYNELYRIFPQLKRDRNPYKHPSLFGKITREFFYALLDGDANDFFDRHNVGRKVKNHQFLTKKGDEHFDRVMDGFLIFLRGVKPGDYQNFVTSYNNVFGHGFQNELFG